MTTKHTPGPWRIGKCHGAVVADVPVNAGLDNDHAAVYGGHLIAESIAVCNRPLIAAAPDLLEALDTVVFWYGKRGPDDNLLPIDRQEDDIAKAMRAIAKANGEQQ
ncbi:hypothetical protein [Achromobacter xylosoxidans]|uniref:Uncharacterized protein n=1 Tax=Alcaligenes xylosoxydans xylosoxydans TaxID=85698 RepID=A0A1R1JVT6_ALCXX|nr:hypothetical protein [Achromobacter xylosoxidans]OMG89748.1 hypothetical protein BIZ92_23335 [Achromobacter xylosoxidans]